MHTHAAVRMLTTAGADEALAVAAVGVAQNAAADHGRELATRSDLDHQREVLRADLAALEARLTWRFAGAMLAQTLPFLGDAVAILRLLAADMVRAAPSLLRGQAQDLLLSMICPLTSLGFPAAPVFAT